MCEYCENQKPLLTWQNEVYPWYSVDIHLLIVGDELKHYGQTKRIHYCPMCGRKLEEKQDE